MLKLFSCEVVLSQDQSGNPLMTVPKAAITENEVKLLRHIHGHESVRKLTDAGSLDREQRDDLLSLARLYGDNAEAADNRGPRLIAKVFGVELPEFDGWLAEKLEAEDAERQSKQAVRETMVRAVAQAAPEAPPEASKAERAAKALEVAKRAMARTAEAPSLE